jgi:hypothetical protein
LCTQTLYLENIKKLLIPENTLFYDKIRRQHVIDFNTTLQKLTLQTIQTYQNIVQSKTTPKTIYKTDKYHNYSLIEQYHPQNFTRPTSIWLTQQLTEN